MTVIKPNFPSTQTQEVSMTINGNGKTKFDVFEKELFQNEKAKEAYDTWKNARAAYNPREAGTRAALDAARNNLHAILDPRVRRVKDKEGNPRVSSDRWWKLSPLLKNKKLLGITIEVLERPMKSAGRENVGLFTE